MLSKSEVKFEHPGMGKDSCGECKYFIPGENKCKLVAGTILAQDWCNRFKRGSNVENSCRGCGKQPCECKPYPAPTYREHDTVTSRITGEKVEIQPAWTGGGYVFRNPFASLAQEGYLHAHPEKLGPEKMAEFDAATKGKKLPKRVKRG